MSSPPKLCKLGASLKPIPGIYTPFLIWKQRYLSIFMVICLALKLTLSPSTFFCCKVIGIIFWQTVGDSSIDLRFKRSMDGLDQWSKWCQKFNGRTNSSSPQELKGRFGLMPQIQKEYGQLGPVIQSMPKNQREYGQQLFARTERTIWVDA